MDPASIIGITSAVLSFVDFIGKAISIGRELHDAQGTTAEYRRLGDLASDLHSGLDELEAAIEVKRVSSSLSPAEESLLSVLRQCVKVEEDLRKVAGLRVTKSPKGQPGASNANRLKVKISYAFELGAKSIRVVLSKQQADDLKREFHQCTTLLNIHLSVVAR